MIESDLISEMIVEACHVKAIRIGRHLYPTYAPGGVRGKCRVDNLVIKFDSAGEEGQCYKEALLSTKIQIPDRRYFVEVTNYGKVKGDECEWTWLAQPFVDVVAKIPGNIDATVREHCRKIVGKLIEKYDLDDIGAFGNNWTISNGEPLIYDYGFTNLNNIGRSCKT